MIGTPVRLRAGRYDGQPGVFWAWPVDGYYDIHHAPEGIDPDGSDVIQELVATLAEARRIARGHCDLDRTLRRFGAA